MGRSPCCAKEGLNRGAWTALEDKILTDFIKAHGEGRWRNLPKRAGLKRCGKSCRLRWLNYLRPDIKRGNISQDEEELIIRLHKLLGNRWSLIAGRLPGRTDNEIKNYWNTNLCKKVLETNSAASPSRSKRTQTLHKPTQPQPRVFRTKAVRCSQVFIKPPAPAVDDPIKPEPPAAHFCANADDIPMLDFLLDFNLGELCSSEFFNPDFSDLRALANDDNSTTYNMNVLSPNFSLSQEILPDLIPGTGTSAVEGAQSDTGATSSSLLAFASSLDCQGDLDDFVLENN